MKKSFNVTADFIPIELFYFMHVRKGKVLIIDILIKVRCNK